MSLPQGPHTDPRSDVQRELHTRHRAVLPDWLALYYQQPLEITHGEGRHVWDAEGRRYLDFFGGILTTMTAHALPEVTKAVSEQAERILHTSTLYLNRPMVELAERVAALSGIPDARVFFTTSGTEANDTALLLATAYRRSHQILAMRNSYHGRSFSAVGITGNRSWSPTSLSPSRPSTSTAASAPGAPTHTWTTRSSSPPASPTWRTCSARPGATWPR